MKKITGILQPQLAYHWRIKFGMYKTLDKNVQDSIPLQAVSCNIDYVNREIRLKVRQDAVTPWIHEMLMHMGQHHTAIRIDSLDGNCDVNYSLEFTANLIKHDFELNYERNKDDEMFAHHYMIFKFDSMTPYTNDKLIREISGNELEERN